MDMKRNNKARIFRSGAMMMLIMLLLVALGCQAVGGVDLNRALLNGLDVKSQQGRASISLQLTTNPEEMSDSARQMIELLNGAKLELISIKMESEDNMSVEGQLHLSKLNIPFRAAVSPEQTAVQVDGAKKTIVIPTGLSSWGDPDLPEGLEKDARDRILANYKEKELGKSFFSFLLKNMPNPKRIDVSSVSETINKEQVSLYRVQSTITGTEALPLLKSFMRNLTKDDEGFKKVVGEIYDAVWPVIDDYIRQNDAEELFAIPYAAAIIETAQDRELAIDMLHTTLKELLFIGLVALNGAEKENPEAFNSIFNDRSSLKTALYFDHSLALRKSEGELSIKLDEERDGIQAFSIRFESEAWDLNKPVKADRIEPGVDPFIAGSGQSLSKFMGSVNPQSDLYELLQIMNPPAPVREFPIEVLNEHDGSVRPFLKNGLTYVPLVVISSSMGAELDIEDDTVFLFGEDWTEIILTVGSSIAEVDGEMIDMGAEVIRSGRGQVIFVPARFVVEQLGGTVRWDDAKRQLTIVSQQVPEFD